MDYFVCLDAVAGGLGLHFHVAKVPKEGSDLAEFAQALNSVSGKMAVLWSFGSNLFTPFEFDDMFVCGTEQRRYP